MNGFLLINKPEGPTSFNMVARVRKKFGIKKVGHCGTLDPLAEGLLVLAIGDATRLIQYLGDDKVYEFGISFGKRSETGDREGKITEECDKTPAKEELLKVIPEFIGEISQTPPAFSAIKINGKRAYELARAGEAVEMKSRKIKIYSLDLQAYDFEQKTANFRVSCSSGTYVRTLAQDIAEKCATLGFCSFIRRTAVGNFSLEDANEDKIIPVENALDFPKLELNETAYQKIINGNFAPVSVGNASQVWLKYGDKLVALGKVENGLAKPVLLFDKQNKGKTTCSVF